MCRFADALEMAETLAARGSTAVGAGLWLAMLGIAVVNAVSSYPRISGNAGFLLSVVLGSVAALHLLWSGFVSGKDRRLAAVVLVLFFAAQTGQWLRSMTPPSPFAGFDFSAYFLAARALPESGTRDLYELPLYPDGRMRLNAEAPAGSLLSQTAARAKLPWSTPMLYPPFLAVAMRPLARLPFGWALAVWDGASVLWLLGGAWCALAAAGVRLRFAQGLVVATGLFCYAPFSDGLFVGQIGCLIFALLAAGVWRLERRDPVGSAFCFAVATLIKLTPAIAVPVMVVHRRWRWLAAYFGWMMGLVVASIALSGVGWGAGAGLWVRFWRAVPGPVAQGVPVSANASLVAWVQELFLRGVPRWPDAPGTVPALAGEVSRVAALLVCLGFWSALYRRREQRDAGRDLALAVLVSLAVSPISWWHHYTLALLPLLYLWGRSPATAAGLQRVMLALVLAVGTNLMSFALLHGAGGELQVALAGVTPLLTLAVAGAGLGLRRPRESWEAGAMDGGGIRKPQDEALLTV